MRQAIILLFIVGTLTLGGTYLSQNTGSVRFILESGSYEMPLWYFLVALTLSIFTLIFISKIIFTILNLPNLLLNFNTNRRKSISNNLLQKGMLAMGKGQWRKAEKLLIKGSHLVSKSNGDSSLFLSNAAQAAQQQGAINRRDKYILEARKLSVEGIDTLSSSLAEARIHLDSQEPELALKAISPHIAKNGHNPQLLKIKSEANEKLKNYMAVWETLSNIKKQFHDKNDYQARQGYIAKEIFISGKSSIEDIEIVWSELPKNIKQDDTVFLNYISGLIYHNLYDKAEKLLSKNIKNNYSDPVIHAYTQLETGTPINKLKKVKSWLKSKPENPYLNYGGAILSFQIKEFEQAKNYAMSSIKYLPIPEALALLGKIYEKLDDSDHALESYKKSVELIYPSRLEPISGDIIKYKNNHKISLDDSSNNKNSSSDLEKENNKY